MSVLMRPTLFPMLFRRENVKLLRYFGGGTKKLEFIKVIRARFIVSDRCSRDKNALISPYSNGEAVGSANHVFNQLNNKQNIAAPCSALTSGHFHNRSTFEVVRLIESMDDKSSPPPNECISGSVLSYCLDAGYLLLGMQCHGYLLKSGFVFNRCAKTALVRLYLMLSDVVGAIEALLCKEPRLDNCSDKVGVGLVEKGYPDEALIISMLAENMVWNKATYVGVFSLCARHLDLDLGRQVHNKLLKSCDVDQFDESVCSTMMNMYMKCKEIPSARKVFDRCEPRNVVIWTSMLAGYSEHGLVEESLILFPEMQHEGVVPNESTFSVLFNVSAELFSLRSGTLVHALAEKTLPNGRKKAEDALIDMYSRTGDIEAAEKMFLRMTPYRDIITWNMMICGYSNYNGLGLCALELFQQMLEVGEDPNSVTFLGAFRACCGYVPYGNDWFYYLYELMQEKGVEPGLEHGRCIIVILIKARKLDEALSFISSTPSKWDAFAWSTLLGGCKTCRNFTLADRVRELIPDDVAAKLRMCYGVTEVDAREMINVKTEKEQEGLSWLEIDSQTCVFRSVYEGDPDYVELQQEMEELRDELLSYVSRNDRNDTESDECEYDTHVNEYDTEYEWFNLQRFCYHSEEIAVVYALRRKRTVIIMPPPIRIIKATGKMCRDCHKFIELISKVRRAVIWVRDAYHFHRFQCGSCSCQDDWSLLL